RPGPHPDPLPTSELVHAGPTGRPNRKLLNGRVGSSLAGRSNRFLGLPLTSALLLPRRQPCIVYRFSHPPADPWGRHRISLRPSLPLRRHLPAHADGKIPPLHPGHSALHSPSPSGGANGEI